MFNLDQAITDWRRNMAAEALKTRDVLDELESHLRDDVEQQMKSGQNAEQAFEAAVQRIGRAQTLRDEFEKVGLRKSAQRSKLKGVLVAAFIGCLVLSSARAFSTGKLSLDAQILGCVAVALILLTARNQIRRYTPLFAPILPNSADAKEVLELAREEAQGLHHHYVGTEHLLLGLLKRSQGAPVNVLQKLGLDLQTVRGEIERQIGPGPEEISVGNPPCTPRAKRALALAAKEAKAMKQADVSTEHIFLGLLLEGDGVAARVLENLGVQIDRARQEILKEKHRPSGHD